MSKPRKEKALKRYLRFQKKKEKPAQKVEREFNIERKMHQLINLQKVCKLDKEMLIMTKKSWARRIIEVRGKEKTESKTVFVEIIRKREFLRVSFYISLYLIILFNKS